MSKLKKNIEKVGLSFKKEIICLIVLNLVFVLLGVIIFLFYKQPIVIAFILILDIGVNYIYLSRYKKIEKDIEKCIHDEFITLLPFFKVYISNGFTIYSTFEELISFSSQKLGERIKNFLSDVDQNKTIKPYLDFASYFKDKEIEQLLICIFQMVDDGNNEKYLNQFEIIFSKIKDEQYKNNLDSKSNSLSSLSIFPLIGSGLQIVMITFGILSTIGDMINGI